MRYAWEYMLKSLICQEVTEVLAILNMLTHIRYVLRRLYYKSKENEMKIDRLIGILATLLQKEKVTAPQLAEKFEVSRRTINRDIIDLNQAGIPIVTEQGPKGGISIMDGYAIDKALLTTSDMQNILYGLRCLDKITGNKRYQQLIHKLSLKETSIVQASDAIILDFSTQNIEMQKEKIQMFQSAIHNKQLVSMKYYSSTENSTRVIEPYLLLFRWNAWYIWGYCRFRSDFRLFKIGRIQELRIMEHKFVPRTVEEPQDLMKEEDICERITVRVAFDEKVRFRLIDEFDPAKLIVGEDQRIYVNFSWWGKEYLFHYLSTFGECAEVIEPLSIRTEYIHGIELILNRYQSEPLLNKHDI